MWLAAEGGPSITAGPALQPTPSQPARPPNGDRWAIRTEAGAAGGGGGRSRAAKSKRLDPGSSGSSGSSVGGVGVLGGSPPLAHETPEQDEAGVLGQPHGLHAEEEVAG